MKNKISFQFDNFQEFFEKQKEEFIEIAERQTGEQIDGQEPLLSMDEVINMAQNYWDEFWYKYI